MKHLRVFRSCSIGIAIFGVFIATGLFVSNVYAGNPAGLQRKWAWAHYYQCLRSAGWLETVDSSSNVSDKVLKRIFKDAEGDYYLPSYSYGHTSSETSLSCYKTIKGVNGWLGSLEGQEDITFSDPSGAEALLTKLGYLPEDTGEKQFTIHAHYKTTTTTDKTIGFSNVHTTETTEGEASSTVVSAKPNGDGTTYYSFSGWDNYWNVFNLKFDKMSSGELYLVINMDQNIFSDCTSANKDQEARALMYSDPEQSRVSIENELRNKTWTLYCYSASAEGDVVTTSTSDYYFSIDNQIVNIGKSGKYIYQYTSDRYAGADEVAKTFGGGTLSSFAPTNTERYNLLLHYLQKVLPTNVQNRLTTKPTDKTGLVKIRLKATDGTFKDFYANFNTTTPSSVVVYDIRRFAFEDDLDRAFPKIVAITMQDAIDFFNSVDTSTLTDEVDLTADDDGVDPLHPSPSPSPGPGEGEEDLEESEEAKCYENAKSLGWVICPVVYGLRDMMDHFYEAIEPLLETNDSIVAQLGSNTSGLYKCWLAFRNMANIIFVILFMFIILSQLTGIGIDNYGIKKMLPKLILTAVLVNLSFVICAIAVDASNIVGHGIKGMFEKMGAGTGAGLGANSVDATSAMVQKAVGWIALAGTTAVTVGVAFALEGWALIIPILLFLITVAISVIFALIVLGIRQALVVILIVVAPVAFACKLLPNTESVFKKWFDATKNILMVYPIIGGVIGAGYLTASILMSSDQGFLMTLISGILMVVPYFMIPSLTRGALDSIGRIGSRIGGLQSRADGRARGRVAGSEAMRNFRADQGANARYRRANSRLSRWMDNASLKSAEKNQGKKGIGAWVARHTIASNGRLRAVQRNDAARVENARESVMQGAQAARNNMNRMENGGFEARAANLENKALEDAIADQTSLWEKDGTFSSDDRFFAEVKAAALGAENDDASKAKLEALMRKAAKGSDNQRKILRDAMSAALSTGGVSASQAARYGAHVTSNSIYKSNDRSMHDQATAIQNAVGNGKYGTAGNMSQDFANQNFVGSGFVKGKQSAESAFSYDDGEFDALTEKMSSINSQLASGNLTDSERASLENTRQKIAETLGEGIYLKENDTTNKYANVNAHTIDEMKRVIAAGYGDDGVAQFIRADDTLKVDHSAEAANHDAAMAVFQDRLNRKVADGTYTQEQANRLMEKAKAHMYDKDHK